MALIVCLKKTLDRVLVRSGLNPLGDPATFLGREKAVITPAIR